MPAAQDLSGKRFGKWTVIKYHRHAGKNKIYWCRCDCGNEKAVHASSLPSGASISCGCVRDAVVIARSFKHGQAQRSGRSPEYCAWQEMMKRCFCTTNSRYMDYGGRGITVCPQWRESTRFLKDMPQRPSHKHSLGRINNDGNYEPGNVEWQTPTQQARNKRTNRFVEFNGQRFCMTEAGERFGLREHVIRKRLNRGWTVERALTTPNLNKVPCNY